MAMKTIRFFLSAFFILFIFCVSGAEAQTHLQFHRLWPTLQHPWYFSAPLGVVIDQHQHIYISDANNHRILKFTSDGHLITSWGGLGTDDGKFTALTGGMAASGNGHLYVAEEGRIQKFTTDGQFIRAWGQHGDGNGEFGVAQAIATDSNGNVYVADAWQNYRIQKFTPEGNWILTWGKNGDQEGEFQQPSGIAIDSQDNVYVADTGNHRIQKFNPEGSFIKAWGTLGDGSGQLRMPTGITIDQDDVLYVTESGNSRIQKFNTDGQALSLWGEWGRQDGHFWELAGSVAVDNDKMVYTAEVGSDRIQKFSSNGDFLSSWSNTGTAPGEFKKPRGIGLDSSGNVYVSDSGNQRIQKFDPDGIFIAEWGSLGQGDGQFQWPSGIKIDAQGNIYVADTWSDRVQKLDSDGNFILQWGEKGSADGQFQLSGGDTVLTGMALDTSGNIYVADTFNHRIQKFSAMGGFLAKWGTFGSENGEFNKPSGLAIDSQDNIYVADKDNGRIQKFTSDGTFLFSFAVSGLPGDGSPGLPSGIFIDKNGLIYVSTSWPHDIQAYTADGVLVLRAGELGTSPGSFNTPLDLAINQAGDIYVADESNHRIQVFTPVASTDRSKAIVVAGGGQYPGNNLWEATAMNANFAYNTLSFQGFSKHTIQYLSSDTGLDLDNNGKLDDVDCDATLENLQQAISTWAGADIQHLILYLVDHGGNKSFRMNSSQILSASDLDSWLDTLQDTTGCKVTIIYDACDSGSFLSELAPPFDQERIVMTSTSPGESAYFVSQGAISFSSYFWLHTFNGLDLKNAFSLGASAMQFTTAFQTALIDSNGNGIGNEPEDFTLAQDNYIGSGLKTHDDIPVIGSVFDPISINGVSQALLTASNVTDDDGIARVWAVIRPPNYEKGALSNPVQELPAIDLLPLGNGHYERNYNGFHMEGIFQVSVYATDREGNTSIPKISTVSLGNPLRKRAVILCGDGPSNELWPAIENNARLTYQTLLFQGYQDEDIYFLSPVAFSSGVDGLSTLENLTYAMTTWAASDTQDFLLYMIGPGDDSLFHINDSQTLFATHLDSLLDNLQETVTGVITVVFDGSRSGSFIAPLASGVTNNRILISSTSSRGSAQFLLDGAICFSRFFWLRVLNGMNIRDAFVHAKNAVRYHQGQDPQMDDNGNGIGNEKSDGSLSRDYRVGTGIMLAGDDPFIGTVMPGQTLSGTASAMVWADEVTTTGTIDRVWAVIDPPGYLNDLLGQPVPIPDIVEMTRNANGRYEGVYQNFTTYGTYKIFIFARDTENNMSAPIETWIFQGNAPDLFEADDSLETAGIIVPQVSWQGRYDVLTQRHNFHKEADEDFCKFYGLAGESFEIIAENLDVNCDVAITLYDTNQSIIFEQDDYGYGESEFASVKLLSDGYYYIKVQQYDSLDHGMDTGYDLKVYHPFGGIPGQIIGRVTDSMGNGFSGAIVTSALSHDATTTYPNGYFILILPSGTHTINIAKNGQTLETLENVVILGEGIKELNVMISLDSDGDGVMDGNDLCPATLPGRSVDSRGCILGKGDLNGDHKIDVQDALIGLNIIILQENLINPSQDVNGDEKIGIKDTLFILQYAGEKRKE